ncbi:MAG: terminase small subunit [Hyphomonadaceae bacterium]|nr:terminase small subunit [Hyphomonadaceae bacterium]
MTHPDPLDELLGTAAAPQPVAYGPSDHSGQADTPQPAEATPEPIPAVLHEIELGRLLGVSASQVRYLAKEGVALRVKPSHYATRPTVANYVARLSERAKRAGNPKGNAQLDAEKLRGAKATADKIELANAKAREDVVPAGEVERAWANVLRDVRSALLAVPSRIGATLPHLSAHDVAQIDSEIKAALEGLANGN